MIFSKISKRGMITGLLASAALLAAGLSTSLVTTKVQAEEIVAKMAFHWNPKHHSAKHAIMFADEVNKRAAGKLKIEVFPSGQLFGIREILGGVTSGAVQLGGEQDGRVRACSESGDRVREHADRPGVCGAQRVVESGLQ